MNPELRDILFLDIETVASTKDFNALDERFKVQWSRKASFLRREDGELDEELYARRAGIYAEFGKIVCISAGKLIETPEGEIGLRLKSYADHDEYRLLTDFKEMLERLDPDAVRLCAHNGKEFDFPYICRRMLINGIALPKALDIAGKKPWEVLHLDTLELWKFGDHKHYTSLDLLAAIFNIPSSKNGIDGSQVNAVYHDHNDLQKIKDYCLQDVVVLAQLLLRFKGLPGIRENNIEYAKEN